ncbi:MAG: N-acetylmuramoyl-L-alanine amidase [candidate division KSB1 bacterium]|nr:N-acetylmuramoyl-L-alanine amidase [candidate division KSB1 bacterium]
MKRRAFALIISTIGLLTGSASLLSQVRLSIVYPQEGDTLRAFAYDSTYIFGQVSPPHAKLTINDQPVRVYKNGAFLAYLPLAEGEFFFRCLVEADGTQKEFMRRIFVLKPKRFREGEWGIDPASVEPRLDHQLTIGDRVTVAFQGTPGCRAYYRLNGGGKLYPMQETAYGELYYPPAAFGDGSAVRGTGEGWYVGTLILRPEEIFSWTGIEVLLINAFGDTAAARARGRIALWPENPPQMAETTRDKTVLRTQKGKSYAYFLPPGVRCRVTGQVGDYYRIRLSDSEDAWAESDKVRLLPEGTPWLPAVVRVVRAEDRGNRTRVRVYTGVRIPYKVEQLFPQQIKVTFFGAVAHTDWIRRLGAQNAIREIQWRQESREVFSLILLLRSKHQWGYRADYDADDCFYIDIKKPLARHKGLKGVTVLLDPGHTPDSGAVGPAGIKEKDVNLALAREAAKELQKRGAKVKWTHQSGEGIALNERARLAEQSGCDILLSLHHNAVPDGVNPLLFHGSSVYYYHPQSEPLARLIHEKLLQKLKLPDFGLFYDNLAMCRPTSMPAVLIEPAFMIHPLEEMLVQTDIYLRVCSRAIVEGLEEFIRNYGE